MRMRENSFLTAQSATREKNIRRYLKQMHFDVLFWESVCVRACVIVCVRVSACECV